MKGKGRLTFQYSSRKLAGMHSSLNLFPVLDQECESSLRMFAGILGSVAVHSSLVVCFTSFKATLILLCFLVFNSLYSMTRTFALV